MHDIECNAGFGQWLLSNIHCGQLTSYFEKQSLWNRNYFLCSPPKTRCTYVRTLNTPLLLTFISDSANQVSNIHLESGARMFEFSFFLPVGIPMSFEGGVGFVRYTLKARCYKPWGKHKDKLMFNVGGYKLDLNTIQNHTVRHPLCSDNI